MVSSVAPHVQAHRIFVVELPSASLRLLRQAPPHLDPTRGNRLLYETPHVHFNACFQLLLWATFAHAEDRSCEGAGILIFGT